MYVLYDLLNRCVRLLHTGIYCNRTCEKKVDPTATRTQGLWLTVSARYHWATEPHCPVCIAQLGDRRLVDWEVAGSIPGRSIPKDLKMLVVMAALVQWFKG